MKIWKKIFVYSITLFIVLFNGAGIAIIQNIYNRNLDNAIVAAINEQKSIKNSIYINLDSIDSNNSNSFWMLLKNYIYGDVSKIENIEVFNDKNEVIINDVDMNIDYERLELNTTDIDESKFIIRNVDNKNLIFVSSAIKIDKDIYKLVITKDISFLNEERIKNYEIFIVLSGLVTILLAIGMYIISKNITNPIEELTEVSNSITKGDYTKRSSYKNNDEIGILSKNFNAMMQEIEDKIDELKNINNQKQRFIDNLTHEMKTPITSIIGYSDLLLKGNISESIKLKALDYINSQGKRLENMSSSLIKLIMIQNNDNIKDVFFIKDVVSETIKGLNYKIDKNEIDIKIDLKNERVIGDKQLIVLLITNILDNSIKVSEKGSYIYIRGAIKNLDKYELQIIDEGFGISEIDLKKVREPFYMVDKSRSKSTNNLGLGLAICQEICIANDIEFDIESEINKGTKVTLTFKMEKIKHE